MSFPRFYLPQLAQTTTGFLDGPEARHAMSVLRLTVNDRIYLFDGQGGEALARIVAAERNRMGFEVIERIDRDCELAHSLTLAIALPKGDRQRTLVDAATELGVTHFVPLRTQRGVAQPTDNALERLQRSVIEASKQCGRNRLMRIEPSKSVAEISSHGSEPSLAGCGVSRAAGSSSANRELRLVAHPYDEVVSPVPLRQVLEGVARPVTIAIGPEGGFTAEEVHQLVGEKWQVVDLGETILRVEIAALAAVAQIAAWLRPPRSRPT